MTPEPVATPSAAAVGPYSPAVRAGDWIVVSGQIGIDPSNGQLVAGGVVAQARQALANLAAILNDCGCGWEHVAKVALFVATESPQWMQEVNAVYAEVVGENGPPSLVGNDRPGRSLPPPLVGAASGASSGNDRPGRSLPARSTVGVAWLPMGAEFEIEAWVYKPQNRPEA